MTGAETHIEHVNLGASLVADERVVQTFRARATRELRRPGSSFALSADIELEIEALTPNTTRLSVTATRNGGFIRDSATATEIILQTEKLVGTG